MFCPLCRVEYREGFARCPDCGLDLVASLDLPEVIQNPPMLFWTGRDEKIFDLLLTALRDAEIPCAAMSQPRNFLARRLLPDASIRVRKSDLDAAKRIAAEAMQHLARPLLGVQRCPSCEAEYLAGVAYCPSCGALLIAEEVAEPELSANSSGLHRDLVCPLCAAEFSKEYTQCTECGVELVPWEEAQEPIDSELAAEPLEVIWQGSDPVGVSHVLAELRSAGIPHRTISLHDHLAWGMGIPRPRYRVMVFHSSMEMAWELLSSIQQSPPFARSTPDQRQLGEEPILPDPGAPDSSVMTGAWKPKEATVEVWAGDDTAFARQLCGCFIENYLRSRLQDESPGLMRVFVRPSDESRAREILREITEGTPPS